MPDVSELLAPLPELMLLEPELERDWRSRQSLYAWPVRPAHAEEGLVVAPVEGVPMFEEPAPVLGEPIDDPPVPDELLPLGPPIVPCAQANCASARAETAHALTSIREVFPICTLLVGD